MEETMSTNVASKTATQTGAETRILNEGYGPGAWHGPDLKAALADVDRELAFWRPAPDRHNIAEIALHHAYTTRAVRGSITGAELPRFVLEGDDWFHISDETRLTWPAIQRLVEEEHAQLARVMRDLEAGRTQSALPDDERFTRVLGITCHAVYHAGQVQLIKRLRGV
jgi:hypothetical protein